jgi:hypothetical protein
MLCSICKKPLMPFTPGTCKDENDNTVHIECYMKKQAVERGVAAPDTKA